MNDHDGDKEITHRGISGWRKAAIWLIGATLLAIVGYRSALGNSVAGAAPAITETPSTAATPPPFAVTGRAANDAPPETAPSRASPASPAKAETTGQDASAALAADPPAGNRAPEPPPNGAAPSQAITPDGKIVLNLATEVELRKLPGIGKARARAIVEQRERLGRFRRIEDLLRVKGIGRKRLIALRPRVVLDPP